MNAYYNNFGCWTTAADVMFLF